MSKKIYRHKKLSPPLKWHGGKTYLARRITNLMPQHQHYVEPYCGGAAVLLTKNGEGVSEVMNDVDGRLMNFWGVLKDKALFAKFQRQIEATPFSEAAWVEARKHKNRKDRVADAVAFFIECRQSLAGRRDVFAPLSRNRTRRGMNEQASAWLTAVEGLPAIHARLKRVVVLNRPALKVLQSEDARHTLFYLDPPYLHATRASPTTYRKFEMSEQDHRDLLDVLPTLKGKVMLSGYRSRLYDRALRKWHRHDFDLPNNAAAGATKRRVTECLWCNFTTKNSKRKSAR